MCDPVPCALTDAGVWVLIGVVAVFYVLVFGSVWWSYRQSGKR